MSDTTSTGPGHSGRPGFVLGAILFFSIVGILLVLPLAWKDAPSATSQPDLTPPGQTQPSAPPTTTPESTPTPKVDYPGHPCTNVKQRYFANEQGLHRFGTPLVGSNLDPKVKATAKQAGATRDDFWYRLCRDEVFAEATLATLDPSWDKSRPHSRDEVLRRIIDLANWDDVRLVYRDVPDGSWTYYMVPGHTPKLFSARYTSGASWFLVVKSRIGEDKEFRIVCGGQGVVPKRGLNHSITRG